MIDIHEFLGLTTDNHVKNLEFINRLINLNKIYSIDQIRQFYNSFDQKNNNIIYNNEEILSLTEIMKSCPHFECIMNNNYNKTNVHELASFPEDITLDVFLSFISQRENHDFDVEPDFIILCVKIINLYYDDERVYKLFDFLTIEFIDQVVLNKHTFERIISKMNESSVPALMAYEITSYNEYISLLEKIDNENFREALYSYIKSQGIINNTIFYCALKICDDFYALGTISNLNFKQIILYCFKEDILRVNNKYFKEGLLAYVLRSKYKFDIELFVFSITEDTYLKYEDLKFIEVEDFANNEIYLIYLEKKYNIVKDKSMLKHDVQEVITNKLYTKSFLKYILKYNIDFQLLNDLEVNMLAQEKEIINYLLPKYFRTIIDCGINIETLQFKKYEKLYQFIKYNKVTEVLPILTDYSTFLNDELKKIIIFYLEQYEINSFIHIFSQRYIDSEKIYSLLLTNYNKINKPLDKLIVILNYNLLIIDKEKTIDLLMHELTKTDKIKLTSFVHSFRDIKQFFYVDNDSNISLTSEIVHKFYEKIECKLEFIDKICSLKLHHAFLAHFFMLLFEDNYDPFSICKRINNVLTSSNYNKNIISMCAEYYLNTVLKNEFFQEQTLKHVRDFLNILYLFLKENGRNIKIYKYCEEMISRIKYFSIFFDCDLVLKNIKRLSY